MSEIQEKYEEYRRTLKSQEWSEREIHLLSAGYRDGYEAAIKAAVEAVTTDE